MVVYYGYMNTNRTPRLSPAQAKALTFLAGPHVPTTGAQIKIATARPLIAAGLVTTTDDLDANAAHGGWARCALTAAGRAV